MFSRIPFAAVAGALFLAAVAAAPPNPPANAPPLSFDPTKTDPNAKGANGVEVCDTIDKAIVEFADKLKAKHPAGGALNIGSASADIGSNGKMLLEKFQSQLVGAGFTIKDRSAEIAATAEPRRCYAFACELGEAKYSADIYFLADRSMPGGNKLTLQIQSSLFDKPYESTDEQFNAALLGLSYNPATPSKPPEIVNDAVNGVRDGGLTLTIHLKTPIGKLVKDTGLPFHYQDREGKRIKFENLGAQLKEGKKPMLVCEGLKGDSVFQLGVKNESDVVYSIRVYIDGNDAQPSDLLYIIGTKKKVFDQAKDLPDEFRIPGWLKVVEKPAAGVGGAKATFNEFKIETRGIKKDEQPNKDFHIVRIECYRAWPVGMANPYPNPQNLVFKGGEGQPFDQKINLVKFQHEQPKPADGIMPAKTPQCLSLSFRYEILGANGKIK